jgi:hypothetical protein
VNRRLIAHRFLQCLEGHGHDVMDSKHDICDFEQTGKGRIVLDVTHNNVELEKFSPELEKKFLSEKILCENLRSFSPSPEKENEEVPLYLHRKGAAPTTVS